MAEQWKCYSTVKAEISNYKNSKTKQNKTSVQDKMFSFTILKHMSKILTVLLHVQ